MSKLEFYYINYEKLDHVKNKLYNKNGRKYYVSLKLTTGYQVFIPLKSKLNHRYGIISINGNGLDLHKAIVIEDSKVNLIIKNPAIISNKEYNVLYSKQGTFLSKFNRCVNDYIVALATPKDERSRIQQNLINHTTLCSFHKELNIDQQVQDIINCKEEND